MGQLGRRRLTLHIPSLLRHRLCSPIRLHGGNTGLETNRDSREIKQVWGAFGHGAMHSGVGHMPVRLALERGLDLREFRLQMSSQEG